MIERSQRRKAPKAQPNPEVLLRLHERLASQRLWFFRLLCASGLALVVSFVLWLVRVPLVWHLVGIALGFLAGLFLQLSMKAWALTWIRQQTGLSYETALEQRSGENQKDDFGFSHFVTERATEEASRLTPPKYQAWWLPMLAVALGLAFLPLIPSITNLPTSLTTQPTPTPLPELANQPANSVEPSQPQPTSQPVAEPPQDGQAPSQNTGDTDTSQLDGSTGSSASPNSNAQNADDEALDRFLDNLRENEPSQEGTPDVDLSSVMQPSSGNGQPSDEDRGSRPRNEQVNPFEQAGNNQTGNNQNSEAQQQQAPQDAAQNSEESEQGQPAGAQQSESQSDEGQTSAEGESAQGAEQQGSEQGAQQQGEGQQAQGEQAQNEQGQEGAGESGMNAEGQGAEEGRSDSGQNAEGAGSLPGTPTGQGTEVAGSSQQNPDFLPGQISDGPNNVAGTARLPGETEELVFPEGSAPSFFNRAEEEALTEGRIPLEYQQVIRNYFREQ